MTIANLLRAVSVERVACFLTLKRGETWEPAEEFAQLRVALAERRYETGFHRGGAMSPFLRWAAWMTTYRRHFDQLVNSAVTFAREQACDSVLTVLESSTNIDLACAVAKRLNVPHDVLVWETPGTLAKKQGQLPLDLASLDRTFGQVLKSARRIGVISESMKEWCESRYEVRCQVLPYTVPVSNCSTELLRPKGSCVIAFSGRVAARDELDDLQRALDSVDWSIDGRPIELWIFADQVVLESRVPRDVRVLGSRAPEQLVAAMSGCADIAFLPQSFNAGNPRLLCDSGHSEFATYLGARLPILFYGPEDSSIGRFMRTQPCGSWVRKQETESLIAALRALCRGATRKRAVDAIDRALTGEFDPVGSDARLRGFVG